jgi:thioredoxin 1
MKGTAAASRTQIIKINVDEHPQIAEQLRISNLPTLMMIEDGKVTRRQTGVADKSRLLDWMR